MAINEMKTSKFGSHNCEQFVLESAVFGVGIRGTERSRNKWSGRIRSLELIRGIQTPTHKVNVLALRVEKKAQVAIFAINEKEKAFQKASRYQEELKALNKSYIETEKKLKKVKDDLNTEKVTYDAFKKNHQAKVEYLVDKISKLTTENSTLQEY
ncbi:unnamed protein product [Sphenostylis stenocarpa]|uniref:Uncharacterized protein n=1 Tax=Sphenostylis stenocarpa TaxID=92480 RepID=A0AA86RZ31_9FABA|nr:unnamed protein product [Sphenostylis stenocarpa]